MGEYIPVQTTRVPASWGERYDLAYDRYYSPYCPSLPRQYPRSTSSSRYICPVPSFLLIAEVHCSLQRPASSSTAERRSDAGSKLPEYFTKRRGLSTEEGDGVDHVKIDVEREGREERVHRVDITARPHQRVFVKSQSSPQMVTGGRNR